MKNKLSLTEKMDKDKQDVFMKLALIFWGLFFLFISFVLFYIGTTKNSTGFLSAGAIFFLFFVVFFYYLFAIFFFHLLEGIFSNIKNHVKAYARIAMVLFVGFIVIGILYYYGMKGIINTLGALLVGVLAVYIPKWIAKFCRRINKTAKKPYNRKHTK